MSAKQAAIAAIYVQVAAPDWAAPNLDALTDVLRDLSWLPAGPVQLHLPALNGLTDDERHTLLRVLARSVTESIGTERPIHVRDTDADN